jgi:hypothetical protein
VKQLGPQGVINMQSLINTAFAVLLMCCGVQVNAAASPSLITDTSGNILGVTDLPVWNNTNTHFYGYFNVSFEDGSCAALFSGCDDKYTDFALPLSSNLHGMTALVDFLGEMDNPEQINGCESLSECRITAPHNPNLSAQTFGAHTKIIMAGSSDFYVTESNAGGILEDFFLNPSRTFAVFTPAAAVPLPAAAWLFSSALLGFTSLRRKALRKNNQG